MDNAQPGTAYTLDCSHVNRNVLSLIFLKYYEDDKMKKNIKNNTILTGIAGEYFVAAELSKREFIASITLRNTKGIDILCSNSDTSKTVGIQVKTNKKNKKDWILGKKAEEYYADNLYYVFVNLNNNETPPEFHIVPSKKVADTIKKSHEKWLTTPGRNGRIHKDTSMRKFNDNEDIFLDRWDLIDKELVK